jgi:hypothetical protein
MHVSLIKFRPTNDFWVFRLTKIANVERCGRRQMLSAVVQDKCWALWYKTNVEHCGTKKSWALWYKTNVEHCGTIQVLSTVVQDKCWALWYKTSVEHCGTRQMLSTVVQYKCWALWYEKNIETSIVPRSFPKYNVLARKLKLDGFLHFLSLLIHLTMFSIARFYTDGWGNKQ